MPVESAFKLHLITLNRGRLARVIASFGQKLVFLKTGFKGPRMHHAQLWFRMLTPQSRCHPASPRPPSLLCWEVVSLGFSLLSLWRWGWPRVSSSGLIQPLWAPAADSTYNFKLALFLHSPLSQEGQRRPVAEGLCVCSSTVWTQILSLLCSEWIGASYLTSVTPSKEWQ